MKPKAEPITLSIDSLRAISRWAADCAERALPVYEARVISDARPRKAIEGVRLFAAGGKRTAVIRTIALAAYAAARETDNPAASAAAWAACLAASSAYTHPLSDLDQAKHIIGPAAYAALALELDQLGNREIGDGEIRWALAHVTKEIQEVLMQMPPRQSDAKRLNELLFALDSGIRKEAFDRS